MPRLINIEDELLLKTVSVGGLSAKALWRLIKSQPVVDAIPVEWINNWLNNFMRDINGRTYYCGEGYDSADDLLKAWEKENGRD